MSTLKTAPDGVTSLRRGWALAIAFLAQPRYFIPFLVVITGTGLGLDALDGIEWQIALSAVAWVILVVACVPLRPIERARVGVVVVVATTAEIVFSTVLGVYDYRLGNLPLFVPAGHGLVYLAGYRFSQTRLARVFPRIVVGVAIVGALGWGLLGLSNILGRVDVAGALAVAFLAVFLIIGRAPALYAGVFFFVAFLEIWGTWVGTWTWHEYIPGTLLMNGNPPSGAAAGYVLFDIAALALAPSVLVAWRWLIRRRRTAVGTNG
ncbi:MAG: hypothetical protein EXQ74_06355 [Thermoleophilia bacterium]|nr:hypothetical protein [Thermoleophilia bacterium]